MPLVGIFNIPYLDKVTAVSVLSFLGYGFTGRL
jgi:hypothetical protein